MDRIEQLSLQINTQYYTNLDYIIVKCNTKLLDNYFKENNLQYSKLLDGYLIPNDKVINILEIHNKYIEILRKQFKSYHTNDYNENSENESKTIKFQIPFEKIMQNIFDNHCGNNSDNVNKITNNTENSESSSPVHSDTISENSVNDTNDVLEEIISDIDSDKKFDVENEQLDINTHNQVINDNDIKIVENDIKIEQQNDVMNTLQINVDKTIYFNNEKQVIEMYKKKELYDKNLVLIDNTTGIIYTENSLKEYLKKIDDKINYKSNSNNLKQVGKYRTVIQNNNFMDNKEFKSKDKDIFNKIGIVSKLNDQSCILKLDDNKFENTNEKLMTRKKINSIIQRYNGKYNATKGGIIFSIKHWDILLNLGFDYTI